jgi:hypothetical protein
MHERKTDCQLETLDVEACATSFGFDPLSTTTPSENPSTTSTSLSVALTTSSDSPQTSSLTISATTTAPSISSASNHSTGGNTSYIVPFTGGSRKFGDSFCALTLYISPTLALVIAFVSS